MKLKNKTIVNSIVAALIISVSGCASIIGQSSYPVTIKSTPEGTHFVLKNAKGEAIHTGETPATVTLDSSSGYFQRGAYTIVFSKEGYADQTIPLSSSLNGWYWGNILLGGLIGMLIVDPATGAMWKLPEDVSGNLSKQNATAELKNGIGPQLQVVTLDQIPAEMRDRLVKVN